MTVSQLIEVLQTHPGDLRVVVNEYEECLPDFLREARFLRDQLQQRNESVDDPD